MDTLNMLYGGYIYQPTYDDIKTIFKNHLRAIRKRGRSSQGLVNSSPATSTIKHEIGSMLEYLKSEMLHTFSLQMDTMQIKRKKEEEKRELAIFFPRCTKWHPRNVCPLNTIEAYSVCEENHAIDKCPSLLGLKVVYQEVENGWNSSISSTRGGPKSLDHINTACKVQNILFKIQIRIHTSSLITLQLIHHGFFPLPSPMLLYIPFIFSTHFSSHINLIVLKGETINKDGGLRHPNLLP